MFSLKALSLIAVAAAPLASALDILSPTANSTVTKGSYYNLTWSSVDTDASAFSVYLVNFVNWPPSYDLVATDLDVTAGSASIYVPCSTEDAYGYQFNAVNGTTAETANLYVIYAQSDVFTVGGDSCEDPVATASSCAAAATVTVTVSPAHANATVLPGLVPKTVGWCSGYSEPVTLAAVPTKAGCEATATPVLHYGAGSDDYAHNAAQVTQAPSKAYAAGPATVTQWVTATVYDSSDSCQA